MTTDPHLEKLRDASESNATYSAYTRASNASRSAR